MDNRWYHVNLSDWRSLTMLNAVGVDVPKNKSTVSVLQPGGTVVGKPFDVVHSSRSLNNLSRFILYLDGQTGMVIECTGRYHEPILHALHDAGILVSAVNPHLTKNFGNNSIRKVKPDPADFRKVARYALDNWAPLRQYSDMDTTRTQLKTLNSQMDSFIKRKVAARTNPISFMDMTYPGVNSLSPSPARDDGSEKWLNYAEPFWHVDCVRKIGLKVSTERYQVFRKRDGYNFQPGKPEELCLASKELVAVYPKDKVYKDLIIAGTEQLRPTTWHVEHIRHEMDALASILLEHETVLSMRGVGKTLGPQLMAEIGDITNCTHREALTVFAGVDPGVSESGSSRSKSSPASKYGLSRPRKTLSLIMTLLLQIFPADDRVYQFLNRKRSEGKPYLVYMTAGANKFLRIYYGKVKACIASQSKAE